jgi:3-oxoacyl-[acyl-carrier-protein] synthase II
MPRQQRRVVITGTGPIAAPGLGIEAIWAALSEGRSGVGPCSIFDASGFSCPFVAQLPPDRFDVKQVVPKSYRKATKVMSRDIELAVGAAHEAVRSAGLVTKAQEPADGKVTVPAHRMGCHIGAGLIAAEENELTAALATSRTAEGAFDIGAWGVTGMQNLTPLWMLKYLPNMLACHVTICHDCQGPSNTITCGEASALLSIGESMRVIGRGAADACLSGGAESKVNLMAILRQQFAGRLAKAAAGDDPAKVVRPFARDAIGGVAGEGGGILVLEAAETAQARGATLLAELAGFAATQSFCPDTVGADPSRDGEGISDAMLACLQDAGMTPAEIDAVVPFGCGAAALDAAEAAAIRRVFGDRAATLPLVTLAPLIGNCGAGFGAVAAAVAVQCLRQGMLPARVNGDASLGVDAGPVAARKADVKSILVCTPSLGGQNAAIVLRRIA